MVPHHTPVMLEEVKAALNIKSGGNYIDCTVGEGGHSLAISSAVKPPPRLLGIDLDEDALLTARPRLEGMATLVKGSYRFVKNLAEQNGFSPADGILIDLGLSSLQIETARKGFSFNNLGPLDMRFDRHQKLTAGQIINSYGERELADLFYQLGEENKSRRIAKALVKSRPINTTFELSNIVKKVVGKRAQGAIHQATRTFQALRMATNRELENIENGLEDAIGALVTGGRIAVISYHSLEDRLVKKILARESASCICKPGIPICACQQEPRVKRVNRRVIRPAEEEIVQNPRSRSAKLRVAERL